MRMLTKRYILRWDAYSNINICIQKLPKYADRKYENTDANIDMKRIATH